MSRAIPDFNGFVDSVFAQIRYSMQGRETKYYGTSMVKYPVGYIRRAGDDEGSAALDDDTRHKLRNPPVRDRSAVRVMSTGRAATGTRFDL